MSSFPWSAIGDLETWTVAVKVLHKFERTGPDQAVMARVVRREIGERERERGV